MGHEIVTVLQLSVLSRTLGRSARSEIASSEPSSLVRGILQRTGLLESHDVEAD